MLDLPPKHNQRYAYRELCDMEAKDVTNRRMQAQRDMPIPMSPTSWNQSKLFQKAWTCLGHPNTMKWILSLPKKHIWNKKTQTPGLIALLLGDKWCWFNLTLCQQSMKIFLCILLTILDMYQWTGDHKVIHDYWGIPRSFVWWYMINGLMHDYWGESWSFGWSV